VGREGLGGRYCSVEKEAEGGEGADGENKGM
jgi:hypothetical protein